MMRTAFLVTLLAACVHAQQYQPSANDYAQVAMLENMGLLPWPHGHTTGQFKILSAADRAALGQQYFPGQSHSATLATVLYDWSQPDYRRMQFPLTVGNNVTALEAMINYWPIGSMPYVPAMFNLTGSTYYENNQQLKANLPRVLEFCAAEAAVLLWALMSLKGVQYSDFNAPAALYRGGGRDVDFFCNQFGDDFGVSVDDCVNRHIWAGNYIQVKPFWSSTPDRSVTQHYKGLVMYTILPGSKRTSWLPREIQQFSVDHSAVEWLYPHGSVFNVINATCEQDPMTGESYWNVFLSESGLSRPAQTSGFRPSFQTCTGAAGQVTAAQTTDIPEPYKRFFDDHSPSATDEDVNVAAIVVPVVAVACLTALAVAVVVSRRRRSTPYVEFDTRTPQVQLPPFQPTV